MADQQSTLISQSLLQNADPGISRDPFQQAQSQFASRQSDSSTVLSSSPVSGSIIPEQQQPPDYKPLLQKLGIPDTNLAMNDIGKFQLQNRLKAKFGGDFSQNEDAMAAMDAFDKQLKFMGNKTQTSMNESLANANRTLGALFGGKN